MNKFDKIKLISKLEYVKIIDMSKFTTVTKEGIYYTININKISLIV